MDAVATARVLVRMAAPHEIVRVAPISDTGFDRLGRQALRLVGHMEW